MLNSSNGQTFVVCHESWNGKCGGYFWTSSHPSIISISPSVCLGISGTIILTLNLIKPIKKNESGDLAPK